MTYTPPHVDITICDIHFPTCGYNNLITHCEKYKQETKIWIFDNLILLSQSVCSSKLQCLLTSWPLLWPSLWNWHGILICSLFHQCLYLSIYLSRFFGSLIFSNWISALSWKHTSPVTNHFSPSNNTHFLFGFQTVWVLRILLLF